MRPLQGIRTAGATRADARALWIRTQWEALAQQAAAFYQESQIERFLEELQAREGWSFARAEPVYRHFGTPEYALQLSWDHQRVAWVQVSNVIEIFMGYAGTLLIDGKTVAVLAREQWQRDRSRMQRALEQAYRDPRVETRLDEALLYGNYERLP
ncbi:MAG TPA: hypothetical protein VKT82_08550 [Ktedonobacterales bacterium]|nr:hypothetical protein [Ktedonobacterales bacterium]